MIPILQADNIEFSYGSSDYRLHDVSVALDAGQVIALLGPNGSGKSTLIKLLLGLYPCAGAIQWDGKPLVRWPRRQLARFVAYLPQSPTCDEAQTVYQSLSMGRAPYWGPFGLERESDGGVISRVAKGLELAPLLERRMDELSGGQRQRVLLGRCLAQEPRAMLLDEPSTFLDLSHQVELYRMLRDLARKEGLGVLMASHDINLAAAFADRVILLDHGTVVGQGHEREVLTASMLERVYGVPMDRIENPGRHAVLTPRLALDVPMNVNDQGKG